MATDLQRNEMIVSWFTRNSGSESYVREPPRHLIQLLASFSVRVDAWNCTATHPSIQIDGALIKTGDIGLRRVMAFGSECIEAPSVKKWILSIPSTSKSNIARPIWSVIGIVESKKAKRKMMGIFYNKCNNGYGIKGVDGKLFHGGNRPVKGLRKPQFEDFMQICQGDKVEMELNLNGTEDGEGINVGTLSYRINGIDYGPAFAVDSTVSYTLCVALFKHSHIELHR